MASLWQKKKTGLWCVTYREHGRRRTRSLRTREKREALKLKRAIETMLEERGTMVLTVSDRPKPKEKNPTVDAFWQPFLRWAEMNRSRQAITEYRGWFIQLMDFTKAERMGDITSVDIEDFKTALRKQGKRKPKGVGLQKTSVNNALKTISAMWNHGIKLDLFTGENPAAKVERYRLPVSLDQDYLGKEEIDALLRAARAHGEKKYIKAMESRNVYLAIGLMALLGLRRREACFARWDWINWKERIMMVTNDEHFTTKNRRPRAISMNEQLTEILKLHRKDEGYILESLRTSNNKTEYRVDFSRGFKKVCEAAGIDTTPHALRHSFASRHAVAGTSLHVIAGWLGHSTTWITQRYAHFQKTFNEAANNI